MAEEMGIFEVMYNCRAMRRIKPDPVPEELLIRLIDAANQAPSGSNAQNGRWIVVRDRQVKEQLAELNMKVFQAYTAPGGARPAALPHQGADARARMLEAVRWQAEHFAEIPAHIVACLQVTLPIRDTFAAGAGAARSGPGCRTSCWRRARSGWRRRRPRSPSRTARRPSGCWGCPRTSCRSRSSRSGTRWGSSGRSGAGR